MYYLLWCQICLTRQFDGAWKSGKFWQITCLIKRSFVAPNHRTTNIYFLYLNITKFKLTAMFLIKIHSQQSCQHLHLAFSKMLYLELHASCFHNQGDFQNLWQDCFIFSNRSVDLGNLAALLHVSGWCYSNTCIKTQDY